MVAIWGGVSHAARVFGRPDGPPNGPAGPPNGPDGPPNGPAGLPNGPDGPPNGPNGPPNGPDGGAGDHRLRPWYLTWGWIMSHLYMQFGINTVKGRKNLPNNSLERHHKTRLSCMTRIVNENMTFLGNSLKHKNYFSLTRITFRKNTLRI